MEISIYWTIGICIVNAVICYLLLRMDKANNEKRVNDFKEKLNQKTLETVGVEIDLKRYKEDYNDLQISYRAQVELQESTQANLDHQNELYRRVLKLAQNRGFTKVENTGPNKVPGTDAWYWKTLQGDNETAMLFTEEAVEVAADRAKRYPFIW